MILTGTHCIRSTLNLVLHLKSIEADNAPIARWSELIHIPLAENQVYVSNVVGK